MARLALGVSLTPACTYAGAEVGAAEAKSASAALVNESSNIENGSSLVERVGSESGGTWLNRNTGADHRTTTAIPIPRCVLAPQISPLGMRRLHKLSCFTLESGLDFPVPLPNREDGRIDDQFHEERRNNSTQHGCRDALHDIRTRAFRPH